MPHKGCYVKLTMYLVVTAPTAGGTKPAKGGLFVFNMWDRRGLTEVFRRLGRCALIG